MIDNTLSKFSEAARHMLETAISRLPALLLALVVFVAFYILSIFLSRLIRRTTHRHRENLGVIFARLIGALIVLLGLLVATSIVAPSFQAADLIKVLGIGGVAIGFAFQNILQNFLAGLLLLWSEPFRVGDEIRLDPYEGTVEEIQARATIVKTYDERRVVIPNADLFTHSVIVNTAHALRRWQYDLVVADGGDFEKLRKQIVERVRSVPGVMSEHAPEALMLSLGDAEGPKVTLRILWWTKAPRQHEMLASYDAVLSAIRDTVSESQSPGGEARVA